MPKQAKLIKQGILLTDSTFKDITQRLSKGVRESDTLESFLAKHKDYTLNNPLVVNGYKDELTSIILQETNNHRFSRPAQKELTRATIETRVGELISRVGDDVRENVRNIVLDGYNNGLSQDKIADNITNKVSGIGNSRARAIARTEIARTATASDYVINVERGATHFSVDCRDTCCTICEEDYDFGKKEYTIDQVEMLPPRHPNCRCYARFYKKDSMESPLTKTPPTNNYAFHDEFDKSNQIGVNDDNWTKENIKSTIIDFVDKGEADNVSKAIFDFITDARNHSNEGATTYDSKFNPISNFIPGKSEKYIDIPDEDVATVKGDYFGLVGHSHTKSKMPIPGVNDIEVGILNLNIKYNIIYAPGFGVTIIKKSDPKFKPDNKQLKKAYTKANKTRRKYVESNIEREIDKYIKENEGNYHISSIKQRMDRKNIRDNVKHDNIKEQVEFYNNELKQYGVELLYITP